MGARGLTIWEPSRRQNIKGLVLVKELALVDPDDGVLVSQQRLRGIPALRADIPMYDLLKARLPRTSACSLLREARRRLPDASVAPGGALLAQGLASCLWAVEVPARTRVAADLLQSPPPPPCSHVALKTPAPAKPRPACVAHARLAAYQPQP